MQLCMAGVVWCQNDSTARRHPRYFVGIVGGFGSTLEQGSVAVPTFSDCGAFEHGTGTRWSLSGLFEMRLGDGPASLQLRSGFSRHRGTLRETIVGDRFVADAQGNVLPAVIDQILTFNESSLSFALLARYPLLAGLTMQGGIGVDHIVSIDQTHSQVAVSPDMLLLGNNRRDQTLLTGVLIGAPQAIFGLHLGFGYDLPIGSRSTLSPELMVAYPVTSRASEGSWRDLSLRAGIGLRFGLATEPDTLPTPPPILPQRGDTPVVAVVPKLVPTVLTEPSVVEVRINEYDSTEALPLLNQIYFAEHSAELRDRYKQLTRESSEEFSNEHLVGSALDVYYQILNILGRRMRDYPHATLAINGYHNSRENDPDLARARAERLRSYLIDVWQIAPGRIKATGGKLPPNPSSELGREGFEENARVEIIPSDPNVTAPVLRRHIQRVATPPSVVFYPRVLAEAGVAGWRLDLIEGEHLWKRFAGTNTLPDSIRWNWRGDNGALPALPMHLGYQLSVTDQTDRTASTALMNIDVAYHTRQEKLENRERDTTIESYSLLLFNFDSPKVSESDRALLRAIAANIKRGATARLTGFTDSLGGVAHNRELAIMRAEETAKILRGLVPRGVTVIVEQGDGERERFPYSTPEGRAHCRTVIIEVRTPSSSDGS